MSIWELSWYRWCLKPRLGELSSRKRRAKVQVLSPLGAASIRGQRVEEEPAVEAKKYAAREIRWRYSFKKLRILVDDATDRPSKLTTKSWPLDYVVGMGKYALFIYLYVLGLHCFVWVFSSCRRQGLLFAAVHGLLTAVASLVVAVPGPRAQAQ